LESKLKVSLRGIFFVVIKFLKEEEMLHVQEPPKHFTDRQTALALPEFDKTLSSLLISSDVPTRQSHSQ
jgi:hypothetical protein